MLITLDISFNNMRLKRTESKVFKCTRKPWWWHTNLDWICRLVYLAPIFVWFIYIYIYWNQGAEDVISDEPFQMVMQCSLCQWALRVLPCLNYCKQCFSEHWGACIISDHVFLQVYWVGVFLCILQCSTPMPSYLHQTLALKFSILVSICIHALLHIQTEF